MLEVLLAKQGYVHRFTVKMFGKSCCYLTRYSRNQKSYVLSVFHTQWPNDETEHIGINIDQGKYKLKGNSKEIFDSIDSLLQHYETHRISPGYPKIGESYPENEFKKQQQQILDEERIREEEEKRKKEEEITRIMELEQERAELLEKLQQKERELQETKEAAEQQRQQELEAAEEQKKKELQEANEQKQRELQAAEEQKKKELQAADERRKKEVKEAGESGCTIS